MLLVIAITDNNFLAISKDFGPTPKSKNRSPADLLAAYPGVLSKKAP
jgi:hypothetical protein